MSELAPGTHVYIYGYQMTECESKPSATAKANFLTNCFYKKFEQTGMNLTGVNGKKQMDQKYVMPLSVSIYISLLLIFVSREVIF